MKHSAGLLLFRRVPPFEVLLAHPGGPFWRKRDQGAWSIPKGELGPGEDARDAARREWVEETGFAVPDEPWLDLGTVRQAGGKMVTAWAAAGDCDPAAIASTTFEMEWPPRSGRRESFPEVDRVAWFGLPDAAARIIPAQAAFLGRLAAAIG